MASTTPSQTPAPVAPVRLDPAEEAEIFWQQHKSKIIAGIALFVVALVLYFIYQFTTMKQQLEASAAFAGAKSTEELRKVVADFPASPVAGNARLLIASNLRGEGKLDEAAAEYDSFVKAQPNHPLVEGCWLGIASIRDEQNKPEEAIAAYDKVKSGSYAAPFAMLAKAKIQLRLGKVAEGKQLLEELVVKYPASEFTREASFERDLIVE